MRGACVEERLQVVGSLRAGATGLRRDAEAQRGVLGAYTQLITLTLLLTLTLPLSLPWLTLALALARARASVVVGL